VAGNFSGFVGKKSRIWISDFNHWKKISWNSCTVCYFKSNKNGIHTVVFVTLFATNLIEVQQCKKAVNFCWIFVGGSLFSLDLIIADQRTVFEIHDN